MKKPADAMADHETDKIFGRDSNPGNGEQHAHLPEGAARIVEHIFDVDLFAEYESAIKELSTSDDALRLDMTRPEADKAQARALKAHKLYTNACVVVDRFKRDLEVGGAAAMWEAAYIELIDEKAVLKSEKKPTGKTITDQDVRMRAARAYPQQWRTYEEDLQRAEGMRDHLKRLADLWKDRSFTLGDLVRTGRR